MSDTPPRWTLRDLPLSARVTISAFLISVGIGYFSALVNLHFAEASPGNILPDEDDVVRSYVGQSKTGQFERLIVAHPSLPFNGQGSMRSAFTPKRCSKSSSDMKKKAKAMGLKLKDDKAREVVEAAFWKDVEGERQALLVWLRSAKDKEPRERDEHLKKAFEEDSFLLSEDHLARYPVTPRFINEKPDGTKHAMIKSIIDARCGRCHCSSTGGAAGNYPFDDWDDISVYTAPEKATGKSLEKLALTTHVHLLGFAVLYGLTGIIFALAPLPGWVRLPIAPLPLVAQVVDISFWWLSRMEGESGLMFARLIPVTGGIVAVGLGLQVLLTMFSMFRVWGWVVLVALMGLAGYGAHVVHERVIHPHMTAEKESMGVLKED